MTLWYVPWFRLLVQQPHQDQQRWRLSTGNFKLVSHRTRFSYLYVN
jgi:hypothetical protein